MANVPVINNFNAGEITSYLYARNDLKKYASGCLELENFQILPYGGVVRRPALKYLGETKANEKVILVEFVFSTEQTFILEIGDEYIRFWKDGVLVMNPSVPTEPLEVVTPWAIADVGRLRFVQSADVMWFVHPDYPIQRLSRNNIAGTDWTIKEESFTHPVFLDENITDTTLTVPAADDWLTATVYAVGDYVTEDDLRYRCLESHTSGVFADDLTAEKWVLDATTGYTITASAATFDPPAGAIESSHIGSYWRLRHVRPAINISAANTTGAGPARPTGTANSIKANAGERVSLYTKGPWAGSSLLAIWRSPDNGATWEQFRYYQMEDRNIDTTFTEDDDEILYCITTTTTPGGTFALTITEAYITGVVQITAVASATSATCNVIREIGSTDATKYWSEGAWSTFRGYPSVIGLHESRLVYGNTLSRPNNLWLSTIDDFNNFKKTDLDDGAMTLRINSTTNDEIKWLVSQHSLIIGTGSGEWALEAESDNKRVTSTAFSLKRKTTYGSNDLQGVMVNSAVLFVMRQGRKVREFVYNVDAMDYVAPDMTILAEHITETGIVDAEYVQQPDNMLVCLRDDGVMIPMTYERDQDVTGWQRWLNDEFVFESVAVLPKENAEDEIYVTVKITVDNVVKRYVAVFDPREWGTDIETEWNGSDLYKVYGPLDQEGAKKFTIEGASDVSANANYVYDTATETWINEDDATIALEKNVDETFTLEATTKNYFAEATDNVYPERMIENSVGTTVTPAGLNGEVKWKFSEYALNGFDVLYDITDTYARWFNGTTFIISAVADVDGSPTDYFANFPQTITVSGSDESIWNGDYSYSDDMSSFGYPLTPDKNYYWVDGNEYIFYHNGQWKIKSAAGGVVGYQLISTSDLPPKTGWSDGISLSYTLPTGEYVSQGDWAGTITWSSILTIKLTPSVLTVTGLDYIEGKTVDIVIDGMADPQGTVENGEVTLPRLGNRVVVGLPYTSTIAPMYVEPSAEFQQPMGKPKGLFRAVLRFKDTIQAKVGQDKDHLETVNFRRTSDAMDTQVPLYSGDKTINFNNQWKLLHTCYVVQDKPLPMTLIAMIPWVEVSK